MRNIVTNMRKLSVPCREITKQDYNDGTVGNVVSTLIDKVLALESQNGKTPLGLSANQLGFDVRICIVNKHTTWLALINPKIVSQSKSILNCEKCLSWPNRPFAVIRYNKIKIEYFNEEMKLKTKTFRNAMARRICHEIDHLNGIVPTDDQFIQGKLMEEQYKNLL